MIYYHKLSQLHIAKTYRNNISQKHITKTYRKNISQLHIMKTYRKIISHKNMNEKRKILRYIVYLIRMLINTVV